MSFIVGAVIGAGASIVGGAISSKGARDAAKTAAQGSSEEIAFNRESRDLARGDQEPYRKAGVAALDKLGRMTGLIDGSQSFTHRSPGGSGPTAPAPALQNRGPDPFDYDRGPYAPSRQGRSSAYNELSGLDPEMAQRFKTAYTQNYGQSQWEDVFGRWGGGDIHGRASGGP